MSYSYNLIELYEIIIRQPKTKFNLLKSLIMNRIFFVGLCLVGMLVFVFSNAYNEQKEMDKRQIAKEHYNKTIE